MPHAILNKLYQLVVPTTFASGPVNLYIATDDPITLIDTGPRINISRSALDQELKALHLQRSDIERILITHAHTDHFGLAHEIVQESSAEVWTHPYNRPLLEDYKAERARQLVFWASILNESGVPRDQIDLISKYRQRFQHYAEATRVDRDIIEGDTIAFAESTWRAYHMRGHAGGLVCFFDKESRILLSNDHLLRDTSSNPIVEPAARTAQVVNNAAAAQQAKSKPRRLVEYIRELQRTADLEPSIAWTGHGEPIHDVVALIQRRMHFYTRRAQRIIETLKASTQTAYEITKPLFGKLNPIDSFLALSKIIGHLEWLEDQGRVEVLRRDGVAHWHAVD